MKLGRNEPCWCGSGIKYKKCHLNREDESPPELWELEKKLKSDYGKKYCSCPDVLRPQCSGNIIRAHTVSKRSSLYKISRNGHVYGLPYSIFKIHEGRGVIQPELLGLNKASTFTGFCSFHDKSLFSCFEDQPFENKKEQIFFLGYRALAREHFTKTAQKGSAIHMKDADKGSDISKQLFVQGFAKLYGKSVDLGERDLKHHKSIYDTHVENRDFDDLKAYILEFDSMLPIQASGAIFPEVDFHGNQIQSLQDTETILDLITCYIITEGSRSIAVFSWLPNSHNSCEKFVSSFRKLPDDKKIEALFVFTFVSFENTFIEPGWWEALDQKTKAYVIELLQPITPANLTYSNDKGAKFCSASIVRELDV